MYQTMSIPVKRDQLSITKDDMRQSIYQTKQVTAQSILRLSTRGSCFFSPTCDLRVPSADGHTLRLKNQQRISVKEAKEATLTAIVQGMPVTFRCCMAKKALPLRNKTQ